MDLSRILDQPAKWMALLSALMLSLVLASCAPVSGSSSALALPQDALAAAETPVSPVPTTAALKPYVPTLTPVPSATWTAAPPATLTPQPTSTSEHTATPLPTSVPTSTPLPTAALLVSATLESPIVISTVHPSLTLNGLPFSAIAVLPPEVAANVQEIFRRGQELGRNPRAFSKVGDSLVLTDHYLTRFDRGNYNLGPFAALQPTVEQYAGSFGRFGVSAKVGLYADFATRAGLANSEWCDATEHMMACEFRLHNPGIVLIRVGTNDVVAASAFETALNRIVEYSIENGVVPVLGTKADRFEGDNRNNDTIRKVADEHRIPLWDFDLVAGTLPDRGLSGDQAHLTVYKHNDYADPATLQFGYPASDLSALIVLDALRALNPTP